MRIIRVYLVDDNVELLESLGSFLATDERVEVVGQSRSIQEALEAIPKEHPDVVLVEFTLPKMGEPDALRCLHNQANPPIIISMSLFDSPEYRAAALESGADAYIAKSDFERQYLKAIHALFYARPHAYRMTNEFTSRGEKNASNAKK